MRTIEIIVIVVLAIIILIALSYIIVKCARKCFKSTRHIGGNLIYDITDIPIIGKFFPRKIYKWDDYQSSPFSTVNQIYPEDTNETIIDSRTEELQQPIYSD